MVLRDQDKFVFYVNNYINWDQVNQLYNPNLMEKGIRNADTVARKLEPTSIRATNDRLEVIREEKVKKRRNDRKVESRSYGRKTAQS